MKKSDLIAALAAIPGDPEILVDGYESGFDSIVAVLEKEVCFVRNSMDFSGEFEEPSDLRPKRLDFLEKIRGERPVFDQPITAIVIRGNRR